MTRSSINRDAMAIALAVGVFGVSFGVLGVASGLTPAQAAVMSMLVFTGASQYAVIGVLGAGGSATASTGSRSRLCCAVGSPVARSRRTS